MELYVLRGMLDLQVQNCIHQMTHMDIDEYVVMNGVVVEVADEGVLGETVVEVLAGGGTLFLR